MKKAFTLIELVVAVALLAMMISFASLIFDMSIDTHRTAMASAEIMQKLQAITGQLNADFKGLRWDPGGRVHFTLPAEIAATGVRADRIVFVANGDFQSTSQYNSKTVAGNIAIIYYGLEDMNATDPREKVLVRRQTILTSDDGLTVDFDFEGQTEYHRSSLSDWIAKIFDVNDMMVVQDFDWSELNDLVTCLAEGVDDFTIQYVGWDSPVEPFNNEWRPEDNETDEDWLKDFSPRAFKFTFTLYDSKGILEDGKTFTHIVYLGD